MEYRRFGRTGLEVSIAGIGGGGASRLGLGYGNTEDQAIAVVQRGLELGINYIDTAENYGTEEVIGRAVKGMRDRVVLSSKIDPRARDNELVDPAGLRRALEGSLQRLGTDVLDVYHLHRVFAQDYSYCASVLVPELEKLREEGKIRYLGLSESSGTDPAHSMLSLALADNCFDVMMVGFNLFNQSARKTVFPKAIEQDVAIEIMASARSEFSRPEEFRQALQRLLDAGEIDAWLFGDGDPLDRFVTDGVASLSELSYRFAAHEPGVKTVLVGTGKIAHLEENVAALSAGPLPDDVNRRVLTAFSHLSLAVQVPGRVLQVPGGS